ncbi:HK97 gp10 family phage protein, partial [Klebsiella pneumoniae]
MSVEVRIDSNRLERFLRGPGSAGERLLRRRAEQVADRARRRAPGSMSRMITTRVEGRGRGLEAFITCHHPAAIYQEYGTMP